MFIVFGIWAWFVGSANLNAQTVHEETKQPESVLSTHPQVTYTPLRRPGTTKSPPAPRPTSIPLPVPTPSPPLTSQTEPSQRIVSVAAPKRPANGRRIFGFSTDVGIPDGAHLGLVILPANWMRLSMAGGTNSAAWGGRLGLTFVPFGWGPSLSFEAGRFGVASTNQLIRSSFSVPSWVDPYVQQIGYSYLNSQLGLDLRLGNFVFYVQGGYSNIRGVVRSPSPVETKSSSGAVLYRVRLGEDGQIKIHTWSAKLALIYLFPGV